MSTWDERFMGLAEHVAQWSKDPSTKVGAVIARADKSIVSLGFNGYPRGVPDINLDDRDYKYPRVVHAEMNAILSARTSVEGCSLYVTMFPCSDCAKAIIQSGIKEVYFRGGDKEFVDRWKGCVAEQMFNHAGVKISQVGGSNVHLVRD